MLQLPFEIPKSLASYAEHFEENPQNATQRLEKQLKKRGPDAVGYLLLSWFYHLQDNHDKALDEALKARIFAPGSPFIRKFHYYLSHPKLFEAWTPQTDSGRGASTPASDRRDPLLDLDTLIQKLSSVKSKKIRSQTPTFEESKESAQVEKEVDDIVSETLAKIHEEQGKLEAAIRSYQQLKKIKKEKNDYYDEQIERLNKIKEQSSEE